MEREEETAQALLAQTMESGYVGDIAMAENLVVEAMNAETKEGGH